MRLASATTLLRTPRAALPRLKTVSLPSNASGRQLHSLTAEIDAPGTEPAEGAIEAEIAHRSERYLAGLEAYRRHRFRRHSGSEPVARRQATTRLLDYGREAKGPIVLVIPSLINRYYLLDLPP
jgi:polyhydroxyalkanoate synthase